MGEGEGEGASQNLQTQRAEIAEEAWKYKAETAVVEPQAGIALTWRGERFEEEQENQLEGVDLAAFQSIEND